MNFIPILITDIHPIPELSIQMVGNYYRIQIYLEYEIKTIETPPIPL